MPPPRDRPSATSWLLALLPPLLPPLLPLLLPLLLDSDHILQRRAPKADASLPLHVAFGLMSLSYALLEKCRQRTGTLLRHWIALFIKHVLPRLSKP